MSVKFHKNTTLLRNDNLFPCTLLSISIFEHNMKWLFWISENHLWHKSFPQFVLYLLFLLYSFLSLLASSSPEMAHTDLTRLSSSILHVLCSLGCLLSTYLLGKLTNLFQDESLTVFQGPSHLQLFLLSASMELFYTKIISLYYYTYWLSLYLLYCTKRIYVYFW